jgi:hypothetical protein
VILSLAEGAMIVATLRASALDQWGFRGNEAILALAWGSIGAVIAVRKPGNRIGWLFLITSGRPRRPAALKLAGRGPALNGPQSDARRR